MVLTPNLAQSSTAPAIQNQESRVRLIPTASALHQLTAIQRYVLARAATHTWTHEGAIPFIPATRHQINVAMSLVAPEFGLLVTTGPRLIAFCLSARGEHAARQILRVVPAYHDQRQEIEFDMMRFLMCNRWEASE